MYNSVAVSSVKYFLENAIRALFPRTYNHIKLIANIVLSFTVETNIKDHVIFAWNEYFVRVLYAPGRAYTENYLHVCDNDTFEIFRRL